MTKDFIDELIEVVEVKKTVKKSSKVDQVTKAKTFEVAGVLVERRYKHSEEIRKKISVANSGKVLSEEHRRNIGLAVIGRFHSTPRKPMSEENRKKLSQAHKGKVHTEATRRKISEAHKLRDYNKPVMTPNGEFISKNALWQRLVNDGVRNATAKIREWFKLYPNDYYYVKKKNTK